MLCHFGFWTEKWQKCPCTVAVRCPPPTPSPPPPKVHITQADCAMRQWSTTVWYLTYRFQLITFSKWDRYRAQIVKRQPLHIIHLSSSGIPVRSWPLFQVLHHNFELQSNTLCVPHSVLSIDLLCAARGDVAESGQVILRYIKYDLLSTCDLEIRYWNRWWTLKLRWTASRWLQEWGRFQSRAAGYNSLLWAR